MDYKIIKVTKCSECPYMEFINRTNLFAYCDMPRKNPYIPRLLESPEVISSLPEWCPLEDGKEDNSGL